MHRLCVALCSAFIAAAACAQASFRPFGAPQGATSAGAADVSHDGSVIAGTVSINGTFRAFRWTQSTGFELIEPAPGFARSYGQAISADGTLVVGELRTAVATDPERPGAAMPGAPMTTIFEPAPGVGAWARSVSADGSVIVGDFSGDESHAWRSSGGATVALLGLTGQSLPHAARVSGDGQHVVGLSQRTDVKGTIPVRWLTGPEAQPIKQSEPSEDNSAQAVSHDGSVIVGAGYDFAASQNILWRWSAASGWKPLSGPWGPGRAANFSDLSADGRVGVGTLIEPDPNTGRSVQVAFVWTRAAGVVRLRDLLADSGADTQGWTLKSASAISGDGRTIVGGGTDSLGVAGSYVVTIPPVCEADVDGNWFVNGDDFDRFAAAIEIGDPFADVNFDGIVNGDDLDLFAAAFVAGC